MIDLFPDLCAACKQRKKNEIQDIVGAVPNANAIVATRGEDPDGWINIVDKPNTDDQDAPSVLTVTT